MDTVLSWYKLLYSEALPDLKTVYLLVLCDGLHYDDVVSLLQRFAVSEKRRKDFVLLRKQVAETLRTLKKSLGKDVPQSEIFFMLEEVPLEALLYIMAKSDKETSRKRLSTYLAKLKDEELQIDGKDLMKLGVPTGPLMGEILRKLKAALLDDQATCRADQLELAERLLKEPQFGLTKMNDEDEV
jgi:tRNA nucleotidyltransferase (CCA-adding enzyme)